MNQENNKLFPENRKKVKVIYKPEKLLELSRKISVKVEEKKSKKGFFNRLFS